MPTRIENKNSIVTIDDNELFVIEWMTGVTLEREDFKAVVDNYDDNSAGALWKVLHLFPKTTKASSDARNYAAKREKRAGAEAFVIEAHIQRNLFRFYKKFRSIQYPMRAFSTKDAAMEWLDNVKVE